MSNVTASIYNKYSNYIANLQSNIDKIPDKINGNVNTYTELGNNREIEQYLSTKKILNDIDSSIKNNTIIEGRLITMDNALEAILDSAIDIKKNFVTKNSLIGRSFKIKEIAASNLQNIENQLNTQYEGRYLFSGSKTNEIAVQDLSVTNILDDSVTANYYHGDGFIFTTKINDNFDLKYGITAGDQAFQDLIGALNYISQFDNTSNNEQIYKADKLLSKSIGEIIQLRANLGDNLGTVQKSREQNIELKSYYTKKESDISSADPLNAIMQLSQDKTALEALFKSYATTSQLRITDYL